MKNRHIFLLALCFFVLANVALFLVFRKSPTPSLQLTIPRKPSPVLWRSKAPSLLNPPTRLSDGWLITTPRGEIVSLTAEGVLRWKITDTNKAWQAATLIDPETLCAVTLKGELATFHAATGELRWMRETGLTCLQPPCVTEFNTERVLVLLSQEDGTLLCLSAKDGELRWRSPATNRTDGPPVCFDQTLAYGNCDATVYLFSLTNGQLKGSIPLNSDEQIAGQLLPLPTGQLVAGTRAGTLVLLDPDRFTCLARVRLSESETFATPAWIAPDRIAMPTPEGKLFFWKCQPSQLLPDGELQLAARFEETAFHDGIFWGIAERQLLAFRLSDRKELFRYSPGDELQHLSPGRLGRCLLAVDSELLCLKGF